MKNRFLHESNRAGNGSKNVGFVQCERIVTDGDGETDTEGLGLGLTLTLGEGDALAEGLGEGLATSISPDMPASPVTLLP